ASCHSPQLSRPVHGGPCGRCGRPLEPRFRARREDGGRRSDVPFPEHRPERRQLEGPHDAGHRRQGGRPRRSDHPHRRGLRERARGRAVEERRPQPLHPL
ncbi:MAG: ATP-dependent hsl protease ATP-binding subunit HslU, partial [uncultured Microvirga sp.]